jgi:hypothetical protein
MISFVAGHHFTNPEIVLHSFASTINGLFAVSHSLISIHCPVEGLLCSQITRSASCTF